MIESRDVAVMPPPAGMSRQLQKQWLSVQQSQVNQDALRGVLGATVDLLTGAPLITLLLVYTAVSVMERRGILGKADGIALRAIVTVGNAQSILASLGGIFTKVKGVAG